MSLARAGVHMGNMAESTGNLTSSETTLARDRTRTHYQRFHNIYLYITEKCQLRCGHCYMGDRLERGLTLNFDRASQIMERCRTLGGEYITFLGGEPTLHPDLPELVDRAVDLGFRQVMINSNGLLEKTIDRIAPSKLHYISFSVDGASPETHDAIRGEGTYRKTIACIRQTVDAGYSVRIICTISQRNIHEATDLLNLADEIGIGMVNFHVFSEEGRGIANAEDWSLSAQDWISFYEFLEQIKDNYKTSIWYPPTYASESQLRRYVDEGFRGCVGASLDRLSIFPDEKAYVCSVLFDEPVNFCTFSVNGMRLNRQMNEFELFTKAIFEAGAEPWRSGCPAEAMLAKNGMKEVPAGLTSVCRLWKSQA